MYPLKQIASHDGHSLATVDTPLQHRPAQFPVVVLHPRLAGKQVTPTEAGSPRLLHDVTHQCLADASSADGLVHIKAGQPGLHVRQRFEVADDEGSLFTDVHRGEDVYTGSFVSEGPEIVVDQRPGVHVNDGIGGGQIQTKPDRWAAENTRSGIFLASGPSFDAQGEIVFIFWFYLGLLGHTAGAGTTARSIKPGAVRAGVASLLLVSVWLILVLVPWQGMSRRAVGTAALAAKPPRRPRSNHS